MTNRNYKNEEIKRSYFEHLHGAKGFAKNSIDSSANAIALWEIFSEYDDFTNFNKSKVVDFIKWIKAKETNTRLKVLSLSTQYSYLRRVKKFFIWLSDQPGYKSKILKNDIEFIRLPNKEVRIATASTTRQMPTLEDVRKIIEIIDVKSEVDNRDRALISFALITGMRISAITSLKMKNFNNQTLEIYQNPGDGVKTKNSKTILSTFFPIGWNQPEKYFLEWYAHLKAIGYKADDPIFPSTLNNPDNNMAGNFNRFITRKSWNSSDGARKIFIKRCADAKITYFNPHSFRHLIVHIMSENKLTEKEKKAISLNLGHENIGTTFESYGYGNIDKKEVLTIVRKISIGQDSNKDSITLSEEEVLVFKKLADKLIGNNI